MPNAAPFSSFARHPSTLGFALLAVLPLHAQESAAFFDAPLVVNSEYYPSFRKLLDFDGDGKVDALGYDRESTGNGFVVSVYKGDGAGALTHVWREGYSAWHISEPRSGVGSFGVPDGLDDFVLSVANLVRVYRSTGTTLTPFQLALSLTMPAAVLDVAAGDLDGNGFGDFAMLLPDQLICYLGDSSGGLVLGPMTALPAGAFHHVTPFRVNGLDRPALFLDGPRTLTFRFVGSTPSKARRALERSVEHGCAMPMAAAGDVDGDGDDDVALFEMGGRYRLLRQGPGGALELEAPRTGGPATNLADVDGDGDLDGVCCGGGSSVYIRNPTNFEIALNDGLGGFEPSFRIPGLGAQHIGGVTDLDGDGDAELIAGRVIYYSRGGVRPPIPTSFDDDRLAERALADVDGDGDLDYGIGLGDFRRNLGDGTSVPAVLAAPAVAASPGFIGEGYPGDFDGDGLVDLVTELWDGAVFQGLHLLRNVGGSHLEDAGPVAFPAPAFSQRTTLDPRSSLVADLDGDGRLDLLVREPLRDQLLVGGGLTWIWFNDPAGFTPGPRFEGEQVMAVEDLDGDGVQDLVLVKSWYYPTGAPHLWWRQGLGGRGFASPVRLLNTSLGNGYISYARDNVAFGRFPGEAALEPIWVSDVQGTVDAALMHSLYNPSTNTFTGSAFVPPNYERISAIFYTTEWEHNPMRPFAPDLDANGATDLVYGNLSTAFNGVVYWKRRATTGEYVSKTIQLFDPLAFADVDGDGDPDAIGERLIRSEFVPLELGGSRLQYGQGTAGTGGFVPVLGAVGPFRPGRPMEWRISGGRGGAACTLLYGRTPREAADTPVSGVTSYVDPAGSYYGTLALQLDGPPGAPGAGTASVPLVPPPGHSGTTEYLQVLIADPAAPGGFSATQALRIRWGD